MAGSLANANREIREAERRHEERRLAKLAEPQPLLDRLLTQLEEYNLDGVTLVPDDCEPTLTELRRHLVEWPSIGPALLARLQPGAPNADLIDAIFTIQEIIAPPTLDPDTLTVEDADLV